MTYSPRWWGCSADPVHQKYFDSVFPTLVGVFRHNEPGRIVTTSVFPTLVGVFRYRYRLQGSFHQYSPRWWGCSVQAVYRDAAKTVFPTLVGVFRKHGSAQEDRQ